MDEVSASDSLEPGDAVKFTNWRLSKDGKRIQKRAGLLEETTTLAEDVYGYSTYWDGNATPRFCQIAVLEGQVVRKVDTGAWTQIYDYPSSAIIDHIVKPLEISGKQFVITEKGSFVVHPAGDIRQIGITAPTTMPAASAAYTEAATPPLDDDFSGYATQANMDAVWIDGDLSGGTSTLDTTDPDSIPGPNADLKYMRLVAPSGLIAWAIRRAALDGNAVSNVYSVELSVYFDSISTNGWASGLVLDIDNTVFILEVRFGKDGVFLVPRNDQPLRITSSSEATIPVNKWVKFNISVDGSDLRSTKVDFFMSYDGYLKDQGSAVYYPKDTESISQVTLGAYAAAYNATTDCHIDYITVRQIEEDTAAIAGLYRYAVSFLREGDYGCESNPIKSAIGTIAFTGTGLNDMTLNEDSAYTGNLSRSIKVEIKTTASPQDTVRWSSDEGNTWTGEVKLQPKVYLSDGITVDFAAITGHDAGDYWTIPVTCCSAIATMQQITVASIPSSTDEQVTARKIYRTTANGSKFYYLTTIYDRNVTTEFVDNFPDSTLGDEMEEDRDLLSDISTTIGRFSEYWDDRLWVADHTENVVYYSAVRSGGGVPEEFDVVSRFITVGRGTAGDPITAMKAYHDSLYVFKRNDIYIIQKNAAGYGCYHLNSDIGCVADGCVEQVNDLLMFPSERGLEVYDGVKPYSPDFAVKVSSTFLAADASKYKFWSIVHNKQFNEVWLSIPDSNTTIAWNYIRNGFYYFQFYKVPSCLISCKDSTGKRVVKMGTRDGFIDLCDYGTADHTTPITATYRKGWLDMRAHGIGRLLQVDYELPLGMIITCNFYVDMSKDIFRTEPLIGSTPTSADDSLRKVIGNKIELGLRCRHVAVEFINAEDCGGDCKINEAAILVRADAIKNKIYGD